MTKVIKRFEFTSMSNKGREIGYTLHVAEYKGHVFAFSSGVAVTLENQETYPEMKNGDVIEVNGKKFKINDLNIGYPCSDPVELIPV